MQTISNFQSTEIPEYRSPLGQWYSDAAIRKSPRRILEDDSDTALFFSDKAVPLANHPLVVRFGLRKDVLRVALLNYLEFTTHLEHRFVNSSILDLLYTPEFRGLSPEQRLDAARIHCDESYHALFSEDLIQQVKNCGELSVASSAKNYNAFLTTIEQHVEDSDPTMRTLLRLFAVVVSETLITGTLTRIPKDKRVLPSVREILMDHAVDEARHHAYFSKLCRSLWPTLDKDVGRKIALKVPKQIASFLDPNIKFWKDYLSSKGLNTSMVETVIGESFPESDLIMNRKQYAKATTSLFTSVGALEYSSVQDAFAATGLL